VAGTASGLGKYLAGSKGMPNRVALKLAPEAPISLNNSSQLEAQNIRPHSGQASFVRSFERALKRIF
jgi:hypothetical protein